MTTQPLKFTENGHTYPNTPLGRAWAKEAAEKAAYTPLYQAWKAAKDAAKFDGQALRQLHRPDREALTSAEVKPRTITTESFIATLTTSAGLRDKLEEILRTVPAMYQAAKLSEYDQKWFLQLSFEKRDIEPTPAPKLEPKKQLTAPAVIHQARATQRRSFYL